ncbi:hypothetical protein D3C76_1446040 [compost metagenome]
MVRVDRVAHRFDAEKLQAHGAIEQEVIAAGGLAVEFIAEVGLADQAVTVPFTETVVHQRFGQCLQLLKIPLDRQWAEFCRQFCPVAQPHVSGGCL